MPKAKILHLVFIAVGVRARVLSSGVASAIKRQAHVVFSYVRVAPSHISFTILFYFLIKI